MNDKYTHIFFDLDRTLWDFDLSNKQVLEKLFKDHSLADICKCSLSEFFEVYTNHNKKLWALYDAEKVTKEYVKQKRFEFTVNEFAVYSKSLAETLSNDYFANMLRCSCLMNGATELLSSLRAKGKKIAILTNGFREIQDRKIKISKLETFVDKVFISEDLACQKPNPLFFQIVMDSFAVQAERCLMVGDDITTDIYGASQVGMDSVLLANVKDVYLSNPTYRVETLTEVLAIACL